MRIEYCGEKQYQQQSEKHVCKRLIEPVVEQQERQTQQQRSANPNNLHARTTRKRQQVGLAIRIASATHAKPPKCEQSQINKYCPPV